MLASRSSQDVGSETLSKDDGTWPPQMVLHLLAENRIGGVSRARLRHAGCAGTNHPHAATLILRSGSGSAPC